MATRCECPNCGKDLRKVATVSLFEITPADAKPEADLVLECECGAGFNAFVPVAQFLENPVEAGGR